MGNKTETGWGIKLEIDSVTWPLAITDEKPVLLSITEDAFEFPCNSPRSDNSSIHPNIKAIICDVFGEKFLEKIKTIS